MLGEMEKLIYNCKNFSYNELEECIKIFEKNDISVDSIGKTVLNNHLYRIRLGNGSYKIHINAGIHANEWITAPLLILFFSNIYIKWKETDLLNKITLDIVPMVNPDGINLVTGKMCENDRYSLLCSINGSDNFLDWRSNINGIDLNRNFPAGFASYRCINKVNRPSKGFYSGKLPLSEPESLALVKLCRNENYDISVALHTQGREIYYSYNSLIPERSTKLMPYILKNTRYYTFAQPETESSYAGFKDWFILEFNKPSFTVEIGKGKNPLSYKRLNKLYKEAYPILKNIVMSYNI